MMVQDSPLRKRHESYAGQIRTPPHADVARPGAAQGSQTAPAQVEFIAFGRSDRPDEVACEIPATFGQLQGEYAAIRKGAGVMDCPHRGTILITGADRREFLNRMLTQELKDLAPGKAKPTFWLNRKGRIESDLLLLELGDRLLVSLDITDLSQTIKTLNEYIIVEDVQLEDVSSQFHHIAVHGPRASAIIAQVADHANFDLDERQTTTVQISDSDVVMVRSDQTGECGLHLVVPISSAEAVWDALLAAEQGDNESIRRVRPIGWYAFNTARIEAGTPLFNVDFAADTLPHETGVLHDRVSFTKGCYLGQEIVARIESLGQPKQQLVGLRMQNDLLPVAEAQVFAQENQRALGPQIGLVTSSTISPMLGADCIAFAMLKTAYTTPNTIVTVAAEGEQASATVCDRCFYERASSQAPPPPSTAPQTNPEDDQ
ncbi:MAG: glycine cleavage T C-terminal barrel domain-containing protein [Phycisphaerales bacterium]